jgi:hypothetical protein
MLALTYEWPMPNVERKEMTKSNNERRNAASRPTAEPTSPEDNVKYNCPPRGGN